MQTCTPLSKGKLTEETRLYDSDVHVHLVCEKETNSIPRWCPTVASGLISILGVQFLILEGGTPSVPALLRRMMAHRPIGGLVVNW